MLRLIITGIFWLQTNRRLIGGTLLAIFLCAWLLGRAHLRQTWHLSGESNAVAISPNGQLLATTSSPSERREIENWSISGSTNLELRRLSDGSVVRTLDAFSVTSLAFSPDNSLIAAGNNWGQIQLWRTSDGQLLHLLSAVIPVVPDYSAVQTLAFSPNGQTLVSKVTVISANFTRVEGQIDVWRVADGQHRYRLLTEKSSFADITPDGQTLVIGGKPITLYRLSDGDRLGQLKINGYPRFILDGKVLIFSYSTSHDDQYQYRRNYRRNVLLHRLEDETIWGKLPSFKGRTIDLAFSPDDRYLAAIYNTGEGGGDFFFPDFTPTRSYLTLWGLIRFGNKLYFHPLQTLRTQKDITINTLAFSPDGKVLAAGSSDQTIRLWRMPLLPLWVLQVVLLVSLVGMLFYLIPFLLKFGTNKEI